MSPRIPALVLTVAVWLVGLLALRTFRPLRAWGGPSPRGPRGAAPWGRRVRARNRARAGRATLPALLLDLFVLAR
eukprot:8606730-Alexandrium_andersonii.AAC.1